MAIVLPILSEFKDKGIRDANKAFKDLEGFGQKAGFALKKAFVPATAALAGLAAAGLDAVNAALDDAAAQDVLRKALQRTTRATDEQLDANNDFIDSLMLASNVADDELRPALSNLAAATGDLQDAQKLLTLAVDIAAATGKPLESVSVALSKAYNEQYTALGKLDPTLRDVIKSGGTADEVFGRLNEKFGGAAADQVGTTAGQIDNMRLRMDELKESIGLALVPFVEGLLPYLQSFADWAEENPEAFKTIAGVIGALALSIVAVNVAMALNPFVLIATGIAAIAIAMTQYGPQIDAFFDNLKKKVENMLGPFARLLVQVFALGDVLSGNVGGGGGIGGVFSRVFGTGKTLFPGLGALSGLVPFMADGGIVKARPGGTLALIGEGGKDEAVVPLSRAGSAFPTGSTININVSGALDPVAVGNQIRDILRNQEARFGY